MKAIFVRSCCDNCYYLCAHNQNYYSSIFTQSDYKAEMVVDYFLNQDDQRNQSVFKMKHRYRYEKYNLFEYPDYILLHQYRHRMLLATKVYITRENCEELQKASMLILKCKPPYVIVSQDSNQRLTFERIYGLTDSNIQIIEQYEQSQNIMFFLMSVCMVLLVVDKCKKFWLKIKTRRWKK